VFIALVALLSLIPLCTDAQTTPGQEKTNEFAIRLADRVSSHVKFYTNNADLPHRPAADYQAADTLRRLCESRMISDARVIPYLIDALSHRNDLVAEASYEALRFLTHRMVDAGAPSLPMRGSREVKERVISWWKQWWEEKKDNHPIFDVATEEKAKAAVLNVLKSVEKLKPKYAELTLFRAPTAISFSGAPIFRLEADPRLNAVVAPISRIESDPRTNGRVVPAGSRGNFAWVEIVCSFESADWDGASPRDRGRHQKEPDDAVSIYRHKLESTDILIEARIASANKTLIEEARQVLTGD
jgi:hypothetical protein